MRWIDFALQREQVGRIVILHVDKTSVTTTNYLLRLNVGFISHQNVGFSRYFYFDSPYIQLQPDLDLFELTGSAHVTRITQGLLLQAKMEALMTLECVRCLEEYPQTVEIEFTELYAFSPDDITDAGLLLSDDGKIDLEPLVREEMLLSVPIKPLCRMDCNGLCSICGENKNEVNCDHDEAPIDPRLASLKLLLQEDQDSGSSD